MPSRAKLCYICKKKVYRGEGIYIRGRLLHKKCKGVVKFQPYVLN